MYAIALRSLDLAPPWKAYEAADLKTWFRRLLGHRRRAVAAIGVAPLKAVRGKCRDPADFDHRALGWNISPTI